jgi:hypothetical protein
VWVNASGEPWKGDAKPDATVRGLAELPAVISTLSGS